MRTKKLYKACKGRRDFPAGSDKKGVSRRDWLKGLLGGLCMAATSGGICSCECLKGRDRKAQLKDFWKRVDEIHAGELVKSLIGAARAQVAYSGSLAESERSVIFQGSEAGKGHRRRAEEHFQKRTEELVKAKTALARFESKIDEKGRKDFKEFLSSRGTGSIKADLREFAVMRLKESPNIMPKDAKMAMEKLNEGLDLIGRLGSFEDAVQLLNKRLDTSIEKKFGNPGLGRDLCILVLVLSSMYVVLIILAVIVYALICAITLGLLCKQLDLQDILDDMIDDICGPA
jgi:hypothetical protein